MQRHHRPNNSPICDKVCIKGNIFSHFLTLYNFNFRPSTFLLVTHTSTACRPQQSVKTVLPIVICHKVDICFTVSYLVLFCFVLFLFLFLLYPISPFYIFPFSVIVTHSSIPPSHFNINILFSYPGNL